MLMFYRAIADFVYYCEHKPITWEGRGTRIALRPGNQNRLLFCHLYYGMLTEGFLNTLNSKCSWDASV